MFWVGDNLQWQFLISAESERVEPPAPFMKRAFLCGLGSPDVFSPYLLCGFDCESQAYCLADGD